MKAQCLCAATQFDVLLKHHDVQVCHCTMCRRQSSGITMSIEIENDIHWREDSQLGIYASSDWGERGFCKACGTVLFWRLKDHSYTNINVFALSESPEGFQIRQEIYIDHKPAFYALKNQTHQLTEAESIALFK